MALRVLWIVDHLGYGGVLHGAGMYYLRTIPALDPREFRITLCVLRHRDDLTERFEEAGIELVHLGRGKYDPRTFTDLVKMARSTGADLFHCHGYGSSNFGQLAGWRLKLPVMVHAHDEDIKYPWHQRIADVLLRRKASLVVAVSEAVKRSCAGKRRFPLEAIRVLANGIDLTLLKPEEGSEEGGAQVAPRSHGGPVVGVVARLRREKGVDVFLAAVPEILRHFPESKFLVAGDGPLREELEQMAKALGVDGALHFLGFVQDVAGVLRSMHVVVVPSRTEGFPLALVEAMAMEKPIVACAVGGVKEIIRHGITGVLVPSEDPMAMAQSVCRLLSNAGEARTMARNAREESLRYSLESHVATLASWYRELAGASR